jgi:hypothetical protein
MIQYNRREFNDSSTGRGGDPLLKLLACLFMLIDHSGVFLVSEAVHPGLYWAMRTIGRIAFPIFAYGIAIGFTRTRNPYKYFLRMALWAIVTELLIKGTAFLTHFRPADAWNHIDLSSWTNVMVTFTFAILMLGGIEIALRSFRDRVASLRLVGAAPGAERYGVRFNPGGLSFPPLLGVPLGVVLVVLSFFAVVWLKSDYTWFGLLTVLVFYIPLRIWPVPAEGADVNRPERLVAQGIGLLAVNAMNLFALLAYGFMYGVEFFSVLALPLIWLPWRGKRPSPVGKYFFYVFYPVHFALLVFLNSLLRT